MVNFMDPKQSIHQIFFFHHSALHLFIRNSKILILLIKSRAKIPFSFSANISWTKVNHSLYAGNILTCKSIPVLCTNNHTCQQSDTFTNRLKLNHRARVDYRHVIRGRCVNHWKCVFSSFSSDTKLWHRRYVFKRQTLCWRFPRICWDRKHFRFSCSKWVFLCFWKIKPCNVLSSHSEIWD